MPNHAVIINWLWYCKEFMTEHLRFLETLILTESLFWYFVIAIWAASLHLEWAAQELLQLETSEGLLRPANCLWNDHVKEEKSSSITADYLVALIQVMTPGLWNMSKRKTIQLTKSWSCLMALIQVIYSGFINFGSLSAENKSGVHILVPSVKPWRS